LGQTGIMQGLDYRDVPVLAAAQAVPDSPWFLVAKMDISEVYAPMRERLWQMVVLIGALLIGAGACVGLVWRQQSVRFLREKAVVAETLRESERSLREVVETLPQLVWTCRGDGPCDYLSPQWVAYTGIPEAEQLGFAWLEQLHPDDRDRTVAAWNAAIEAKKPFDVEFRIRRKDDIYRWFKTRAGCVSRQRRPDRQMVRHEYRR